MVRKNTLPYVHQWAVIDINTGDKIGEYKTEILAKKACDNFRKYGIPKDTHGTPPDFENAWNAINIRMKRPNGDPQPKPKRHSNKRIVKLD